MLEGVLEMPAGSAHCPAVVLCHPHPLYGGNMDDNVLFAIDRALLANGIAAFRFNFRGVDASEGRYGGGRGEETDAVAAIDFISKQPGIDPEKIGIAGYSFGGGVAFNAALRDGRVKALALVSPVIPESGWKKLKGYSRPKFYALGDSDEYYPWPEYRAKIENALKPAEYAIFPGTDHFWTGSEAAMAGQAAGFLARSLI